MKYESEIPTAIGNRAKEFSKKMETAFWDEFEMTQKEFLPGLSKDDQIRRLEDITNCFLDLLCCTTVGLMTQAGDTSPEFEEAVLSNTVRWFKTMRDHEKRKKS